MSKSDTSAFRTPLKSTTPNFEFTAEIKEESTIGESGGCNNNSADNSGNNSVLNCESHSSSLEAPVTSVGVQSASRHNILVSPLSLPFTPAYYSSYFIKEQLEMLRTYPPRISPKRVHQNVNEGEEDGSWNEDSPAKRMHRLVLILCLCVCVCVCVRTCACVHFYF